MYPYLLLYTLSSQLRPEKVLGIFYKAVVNNILFYSKYYARVTKKNSYTVSYNCDNSVKMYGQVLYYVVTDSNSAYAIINELKVVRPDVIPQVVLNTGGLIPVEMRRLISTYPHNTYLKCITSVFIIEMEKRFLESSRRNLACTTLNLIFDICTWIKPFITDIKYNTSPHIFCFRRNTEGKAVQTLVTKRVGDCWSLIKGTVRF